jgi:serine/threonine protein phosphatase PrpC
MSITSKRPLSPGDVLLACSDGLWSGLTDDDMAQIGAPGNNNLAKNLKDLSLQALSVNAPYSDNTTGTALRWLGTD